MPATIESGVVAVMEHVSRIVRHWPPRDPECGFFGIGTEDSRIKGCTEFADAIRWTTIDSLYCRMAFEFASELPKNAVALLTEIV
ncbi:hypothetical protein HLRTI_000048 [Halorhabdus tiamatea SARL4B]|uniref:Uncharacterized protein n=2 Tax=Halorhabdus tiamatea SARL4B TaxID=1033806 RepID=U2FHK6_9EURY|nr:hypothetical protein HLRTI_000048 [Halorhabdus tiamatea SARL4B]